MKCKKGMLMAAAAMAVGFVVAQDASIVEARKQIVEAISNPAVMTSTVKGLSADDQRQYLADVVSAISKMPGSQEEAAASYLSVCRAALKGAKKGNLPAMIAEVFATVPPEYLPVISESLGVDMLNRAANSSETYTDERYLDIATNVMAVVNARVASEDAADVRSAFAALAFIRGSNSASDNIVSAMVESLPESARKAAADEWFPAALAEGESKSYDSMLVAASADDVSPETMTVMLLRVAGPQNQDALLADLYGGNADPAAKSNEKAPITDAIYNPYEDSLPSLGAGAAADTFVEGVTVPRGRAGDANKIPSKPVEPHPGGYKYQTRN